MADDILSFYHNARIPVFLHEHLAHVPTKVVPDGFDPHFFLPEGERLMPMLMFCSAPADYRPQVYTVARGTEPPLFVVEWQPYDDPLHIRLTSLLVQIDRVAPLFACAQGCIGVYPGSGTVMSYLRGGVGQYRRIGDYEVYTTVPSPSRSARRWRLGPPKGKPLLCIQDKRLDNIPITHSIWLSADMKQLPLFMTYETTFHFLYGVRDVVVARLAPRTRALFDFEFVRRPPMYRAMKHTISVVAGGAPTKTNVFEVLT